MDSKIFEPVRELAVAMKDHSAAIRELRAEVRDARTAVGEGVPYATGGAGVGIGLILRLVWDRFRRKHPMVEIAERLTK